MHPSTHARSKFKAGASFVASAARLPQDERKEETQFHLALPFLDRKYVRSFLGRDQNLKQHFPFLTVYLSRLLVVAELASYLMVLQQSRQTFGLKEVKKMQKGI